MLRSAEYYPGDTIVKQGKEMKYVHFIVKGNAWLTFDDKHNNLRYNITKLIEGSFYGEYQILMMMNSMFSFRVSHDF